MAAAQGERDRNIENLIGAAGVGLSVTSAAVSSWSSQNPRPIETFGLSLGLGIASALIVYVVLRFCRQ